MNNEDYSKVLNHIDSKLQAELLLIRLSGDTESLGEFLSFVGEFAKLDVISILQPNRVSETFDVINSNNIYNEHYYQKLVIDLLVYSNTMEGGWESLSKNLENSVIALKASEFIPEEVAERIDATSITDPYVALVYLIKDIVVALLIKEGRRNVK